MSVSLVDAKHLPVYGPYTAPSSRTIGVPHGKSVVTPYTGFSWTDQGDRTYRVGTRWNVAPGAVLSLEGTHNNGLGEEPGTSAIMLRAEVRW